MLYQSSSLSGHTSNKHEELKKDLENILKKLQYPQQIILNVESNVLLNRLQKLASSKRTIGLHTVHRPTVDSRNSDELGTSRNVSQQPNVAISDAALPVLYEH